MNADVLSNCLEQAIPIAVSYTHLDVYKRQPNIHCMISFFRAEYSTDGQWCKE